MGEFLIHKESYCVKQDKVLSRLDEKWEISLKMVKTGKLRG